MRRSTRSARGCAPRDLDGARALLLERFLEAAPARFFEGAVSPDTPGELRHRMGEAEAALVGEAEARARRALRPARLPRPLLRRSDRLAPRSGERQAGPPRALDRRRLPRRRSGGGQQGHLGAQPASVARPPGPGVPDDGRRALCRALRRHHRRVEARQSAGVGINWASSLEVAFRIISWSWARHAVPRIAGARRPDCSSRSSRAWPATPRTWSAISRATTRRTRTSPARPSGSSMPVWCFPSCAARGGGSASDTGSSSTSSTGRCCPTGSTSSGRPATTATRSRSTCTSCCSRRGTPCRCRARSPSGSRTWSTCSWRSASPMARCRRSATPTGARSCRSPRGSAATSAAYLPSRRRCSGGRTTRGPRRARAPRRCGSAAPRAPTSSRWRRGPPSRRHRCCSPRAATA